jgi:hypothetical protein
VSGGFDVGSLSDRARAELPRDAGPPGRKREAGRVGDPGAEVERCIVRGKVASSGNPFPEGAGTKRGIGDPRSGARPDLPAHEGARTHAGFEESLRTQTVVDDEHGAPGHAEALCELPAGRQPLAGPDPSRQDGLTDLPVELPGEVSPALEADV